MLRSPLSGPALLLIALILRDAVVVRGRQLLLSELQLRLRGGDNIQTNETTLARWGARRRMRPAAGIEDFLAEQRKQVSVALGAAPAAPSPTVARDNFSLAVPSGVDAVLPAAAEVKPAGVFDVAPAMSTVPAFDPAKVAEGNATSTSTVAAEASIPPYILYSIQTGPTGERLGRLNACLATWASDVGADERSVAEAEGTYAVGHAIARVSRLQIVGVGAPLPAPTETARHAAATEAAASVTLQAAAALGGVVVSEGRVNSATIRWEIAAGCPDTHAGGACKDAVALVDGAESGASWVVLVGDDNYVVRANLEAVLSALNPDEPHVLGIPGCGGDLCVAGGLCGGGGQIFSRGALRQMVGASNGREDFLREHDAEAGRSGSWGDVASCRVAALHNLSVEALPGLHGWHEDFLSLQADLSAGGPEAVKPLTFHYVSPEEMVPLHRLVLIGPRQVTKLYRKYRQTPSFEHDTFDTYSVRREMYVAEENLRRRSLHHA